MTTAEEENWKVDCSDEENYGLTYSEMLQQWVPDPETTCNLFESYSEDNTKDCSLFTFNWICPGRKEVKQAEISGDNAGEEQKTEEKSDFDFWDEPKEANKNGAGPRRGKNFQNVQRLCRKNALLSSSIKHLSSSKAADEPYFITTPIFYVNADPHIGHVYTAVIADATARFHHLCGSSPVILSTGTDEHGLKIQQAAAKANQTPINFCNNISQLFRQAIDDSEIKYSDFIRTTDSDHRTVVENFWRTLVETGYIYEGKYEGWYCIADEMFLAEDQTKIIKLPNGQDQRVSIESNRPVEWFSEENYMFKLSKCRNDLNKWLESGPVVEPVKYYNLLKSWLDQEQPDLSVSRPSSRLDWGIPVPGDPSQTIYVWMDALLNYLTVAQRTKASTNKSVWSPVHVIGKDILKFHGIYWPAFLIAAGLQPPKALRVHGHWLVDNDKMSKTLGNVVSPHTCIDLVTATGLRYFLLHEGVPDRDGNFSFVRMVRIVNAELADGMGNLVNRCCGKSLNPLKIRPSVTLDSFHACGPLGIELLGMLERTPDTVHDYYKIMEFYKGIDQLMSLIRATNNLFQSLEPWKLKKEGQIDKFTATMAVSLETVRIVGILLQPIIPSFSQRLLDKLGVPVDERSWQYVSPVLGPSYKSSPNKNYMATVITSSIRSLKVFRKDIIK
uniref:Methionine--tRNA ligase, mitochondrial n=1 Tax=Eubosmina coregoni TaxID=186181 RepID=A0A4Y7LPK4_9CRUS|nr:EOG090X05VD [Eubosmina coregoni]